MGAWGFKIEDNDTAQDFLLDYNDLIKNGKEPYEVIEELFQGEWYGTDNEAILMAGKLEHEHYGKIMHLKKVNKALEEELREQELSNWADPDARKQELLDFMERGKNMDEKGFALELKGCDIDKLINHAQLLYKMYCDTDNVKYANLCALVREEIKSRLK